MGFRSTFVTADHGLCCWPEWFVEKYKEFVWFNENKYGVIASKAEAKTYSFFSSLHQDIQKVIKNDDKCNSLTVIFLHECGGVTRCKITMNSIVWHEPSEWVEVEKVSHSDICLSSNREPCQLYLYSK